jgi:hypothetical protein
MENFEDRPTRGGKTQVTDLATSSGVHGGESRRRHRLMNHVAFAATEKWGVFRWDTSGNEVVISREKKRPVVSRCRYLAH